MRLTEKQKALIRIGTAYINGETPNPIDIDTAKRSTKGGRPKGMSYKQFCNMLNMAFCYFHARASENMNRDDAYRYAVGNANIGRKSLEAFCSYVRSGATPVDPKWQHDLLHTRAALEQVELGFIKLPNHPDYKPRI